MLGGLWWSVNILSFIIWKKNNSESDSNYFIPQCCFCCGRPYSHTIRTIIKNVWLQLSLKYLFLVWAALTLFLQWHFIFHGTQKHRLSSSKRTNNHHKTIAKVFNSTFSFLRLYSMKNKPKTFVQKKKSHEEFIFFRLMIPNTHLCTRDWKAGRRSEAWFAPGSAHQLRAEPQSCCTDPQEHQQGCGESASPHPEHYAD